MLLLSLQPIHFTEPTAQDLLDVTDHELLLAANLMCDLNPAFRWYLTTPKKGEIKPCLQRVR